MRRTFGDCHSQAAGDHTTKLFHVFDAIFNISGGGGGGGSSSRERSSTADSQVNSAQSDPQATPFTTEQ